MPDPIFTTTIFTIFNDQHMKEGDLLLLKVPQVIIARKLRRGAGFAENDTYLNAGIFISVMKMEGRGWIIWPYCLVNQ